MSRTTSTNHELKQRVLTLLDRLSDRDTLPQATAELDLIVSSLSETSVSTFLSCLLSISPSSKLPLRLHSLRLISSLAAAHGNHLSPHIPKILSSSLLIRLRDSDSTVRSACSVAAASLARHVTSSPTTAILDPLLAALFVDQDSNVQIGAALCLSAAIESSQALDVAELRRSLPKMMKLAKSEGFRAKGVVMALIGSVVAADVINGPNLMANVVASSVEMLSSDDWAARKASAEVMEKIALVVKQRNLVVEVKTMCINALEKRKFDKVKIAREAMNRALEAWKAVCLEDPPFSSSSKDESNGMCPSPASSDEQSFGFETPEPKKNWAKNRPSLSDSSTVTGSTSTSNRSGNVCSEAPQLDMILSKSRSSVSSLSDDSSVGLAKKESLQSASGKKASFHHLRKSQARKALDSKFAVWGTLDEDDTRVGDEFEQKKSEPVDSEENGCGSLGSSTQKTFNNSLYEDLRRNPVNRRFGSRVVPSRDVYDTVDFDGRSRDFEAISLIRKQLIQIERQQANLMELVQTFMGSSQSGVSSLETRVSSIEKALDGISYKLAIQAGGRMPNESTRNSCCNIRGAEFLSPNIWRKNENGSFAASNTSCSGTMQSLPYMDNNVDVRPEFARDANSSSRTMTKNGKGISVTRACSSGSLDGASPTSCNAPVIQRT